MFASWNSRTVKQSTAKSSSNGSSLPGVTPPIAMSFLTCSYSIDHKIAGREISPNSGVKGQETHWAQNGVYFFFQSQIRQTTSSNNHDQDLWRGMTSLVFNQTCMGTLFHSPCLFGMWKRLKSGWLSGLGNATSLSNVDSDGIFLIN